MQQINRTAQFKSALMDLDAAGRLQPLLTPKSARRRTLWLVALAVLGAAALLVSALLRGGG